MKKSIHNIIYAIIYARFSPRPNAGDCLSCEKQIELCQKYAESKGFKVIAVYQDKALTGTNMNRPELTKAIKKTCEVKGVLVCYSLFRLARNLRDCLDIAETLKEHNAYLSLLNTNIDTSTPTGRLLYGVMGSFGQFERDTISERTSVSMRYLQSKGRRMSAKPPYGYMVDLNDPSRIIKNPNEQRAIKQMIAWHKQGMTYREICSELSKYFEPRNSSWHLSTVYKIISKAEDHV